MEAPRPPLPPFDATTAAQKIRMAEDSWNTRDPQRVALAYTRDSVWRNRAEFFAGREAIVQFLTRKWNKELDYRLIKAVGVSWESDCRQVLPMSGMTIPVIGFGLTATKTGNSTITVTCDAVSRALTTCRSRRRSASITGRWGVALISIQVSRIWASKNP